MNNYSIKYFLKTNIAFLIICCLTIFGIIIMSLSLINNW